LVAIWRKLEEQLLKKINFRSTFSEELQLTGIRQWLLQLPAQAGLQLLLSPVPIGK